MGREIRRVPPNHQHPEKQCWMNDHSRCGFHFIPMYDENYDEAAKKWVEDFNKWQDGQHPEQLDGRGKCCKYFWEWDGGPPEEENHRQYKDSEATWYQVYETVSEGTPMTPPFATKEELVNYMVEHGDFYAKREGRGGCTRAQAEAFVESEYIPSGVVIDGKFTSGIEVAEVIKKDKEK